MRLLKELGWGCAICMVLLLASIVTVVWLIVWFEQGVQDAGVLVASPREVVVGESFDLQVTVTNERAHDVLKISSVDLMGEYLVGFTVSSVDPAYKSSRALDTKGGRTFKFGLAVPPGASEVFTFTLRARTEGLYLGDVEVWEGVRFTSDMALTSVEPIE